jgi:hypothetical protein
MPSGPGFWIVFSYYSFGTIAIGTLVGSRLLHTSAFIDPAAFQNSVPLAIMVGLVAAYFNRTERLEIRGRDAATLTADIHNSLTDLGFESQDAQDDSAQDDSAQDASAQDDYVVYQRSSRWRSLSGSIIVQIQGDSATIISRASVITRLRQRLT